MLHHARRRSVRQVEQYEAEARAQLATRASFVPLPKPQRGTIAPFTQTVRHRAQSWDVSGKVVRRILGEAYVSRLASWCGDLAICWPAHAHPRDPVIFLDENVRRLRVILEGHVRRDNTASISVSTDT